MKATRELFLKQYHPSQWVIFIDFDNTITPFDVLDDIIERFSVNLNWVTLEKEWREGKIGSRECLEGQLRSIRVTKEDFSRYLATIPVDPYFKKIFLLARKNGAKLFIVSDSFSYIISRILEKENLHGFSIYSNRMKVGKDRLYTSFPHKNPRCLRCGNCKKNRLSKYKNHDNIIIYIGDGLSDVCPAEYADLVFAKGYLLKRFRKEKRRCVGFKDLRSVYDFLRKRV